MNIFHSFIHVDSEKLLEMVINGHLGLSQILRNSLYVQNSENIWMQIQVDLDHNESTTH